MQRTPDAIAGELWKLAKEDTSWQPFSRRYAREYHYHLRQIPLDEADTNPLTGLLMEFPYATISELQQIGFGKTISRYPGGIKQAKRDAETKRFLDAYKFYDSFLQDVESEISVKTRERESTELKLVRVVFGEIPHFSDTRERLGKYARMCIQRNSPIRDLESYRSAIVADLSGLFIGEIGTLLEDNALREIIEEMLTTPEPGERRAIELRFLADRKYTLEEIGSLPEFGVRGERIRQLEAKALRKLRHPRGSSKLENYFREKRSRLQIPEAYTDADVNTLQRRPEHSQGEADRLRYEVDVLQRSLDSEDVLRERLGRLEQRQAVFL